jgi:hypothetical protein
MHRTRLYGKGNFLNGLEKRFRHLRPTKKDFELTGRDKKTES